MKKTIMLTEMLSCNMFLFRPLIRIVSVEDKLIPAKDGSYKYASFADMEVEYGDTCDAGKVITLHCQDRGTFYC